jgi:uncharacterized membrane protein
LAAVRLLAVLLPIAVHAQTSPLRVELPSLQASPNAPPTVEAGKGLTLVFRISNTTPAPQSALARLQVPEGWQSLFVSDRVSLGGGASTVETVRVTPARDTRAGTYQVRYEVRLSPDDAALVTSVTVQVEGLSASPRPRSTPRFAGDSAFGHY